LKTFALAVLLMLQLSAGVYGQTENYFVTGNQFVTKCRDDSNRIDFNYCLGIIDGFTKGAEEFSNRAVGIVDGTQPTRNQLDRYFKFLGYCFPRHVRNDQLLKVAVKYMDDHPERLHERIEILLHAAFQKAFPCETNK
jgi:Rap1a immunity proteins